MDTSGNILQTNCYGGNSSDWVFDIKLRNSKILITGRTESDDGDITNYHFSPTYVNDAWALVLDSNIILSKPEVSILVNNNFIISPNPVIDFLTINNVSNSSFVKFPIQVNVVNSFGELVLTKKSETLPFKIDLSKFSASVYFIMISDITQASYFRAIKI